MTATKRKSGFVNPFPVLKQIRDFDAEAQAQAGTAPAQPAGAIKLSPTAISPSRWANRHADSFTGPDFEALRDEISSAGGNVQPIKVRPMRDGLGLVLGDRYELVFGHRRHRACLELGLQVLAIVEDVSDAELFTQMERENRGRKDLSAWEQGMMYRRALDVGLFPTLRNMAETLGVGAGTISKAMTIAQLPDAVVTAFPSPNVIQFRWAADLRAALEQNEKAVMLAAKQVQPGTPPARVLSALLDAVSPGNTTQPTSSVSPGNTPRRLDLGHGRHVDVRARGERVTLELDAALLPPGAWEALEKALRKITSSAK